MGCLELVNLLWVQHLLDVGVLEILVRPVQVEVEIISTNCIFLAFKHSVDEECEHLEQTLLTLEVVDLFILLLNKCFLHRFFELLVAFDERAGCSELRVRFFLRLEVIPCFDSERVFHRDEWLHHELGLLGSIDFLEENRHEN